MQCLYIFFGIPNKVHKKTSDIICKMVLCRNVAYIYLLIITLLSIVCRSLHVHSYVLTSLFAYMIIGIN